MFCFISVVQHVFYLPHVYMTVYECIIYQIFKELEKLENASKVLECDFGKCVRTLNKHRNFDHTSPYLNLKYNRRFFYILYFFVIFLCQIYFVIFLRISSFAASWYRLSPGLCAIGSSCCLCSVPAVCLHMCKEGIRREDSGRPGPAQEAVSVSSASTCVS